MNEEPQVPEGWKLIDWDGNSALNLQCWRKNFGRGHVSVGVGDFLTITYSYGPNSDESMSGTRWCYNARPFTEIEAMEHIDEDGGKGSTSPSWDRCVRHILEDVYGECVDDYPEDVNLKRLSRDRTIDDSPQQAVERLAAPYSMLPLSRENPPVGFTHPTRKAVVATIRKLMQAYNLTVVTTSGAFTSEELLCSPIIWQTGDISADNLPGGLSVEYALEAFRSGSSGKVLHDRSVEEGQQILSDLLSIDLDRVKPQTKP